MKKLLIILLIVLVTAAATGMVFLWLYNGADDKEPGSSEKPVKTYSYQPDDAFVTNLLNSKRFLKVSVVIELDSQKKVKMLSDAPYKVRDLIMGVLSNYTEEEILKSGIHDTVKEDIKIVLEEAFSFGGIIDVYFNEFVIQ